MHALSAYDCEAQSAVSSALRALENRAQGLRADTCVTPKDGWLRGNTGKRATSCEWPNNS